jgi:hypothetical protein
MKRLARLRPRRPSIRHLWLVPGLAVAFYTSGQAEILGLGIVPLLVFGIVPHVPAWVGSRLPHARGQLAPRAVPLFNAMHHPVLPLAVLGLALAGLLSPVWLVGAMAWLSHIVVDWALGDGLRTPDGYLRGRSIWNGRFLQLVTRDPGPATSGGRP